MKKLTPEKLDLRSHTIAEDKLAELLRLFPEIRTEGGKIDFDQLKLALGETVDAGKERYGMNWPGKADCFKTIQTPSLGTLRPRPEESVEFDSTENLIIEGDNLEVLKLLQKSYLGKVKMIYIDPPYNTGNDFIYPDNFSESLQTYLQYTGQVDDEGRKFGTNTDTDGRFHSKWLNMMYPRFYLARNLLREDGVIFVSIDDNEVDNLRRLCNEIFGEENFIVQMIWEKGRKNDAKLFSAGHEYIVIYGRSVQTLKDKKVVWREEKPGAKEIWIHYLALREKFGENLQKIEAELVSWFSSLGEKHPSKRLSRYRRVDKFGPWRDDDISWPGGDGPKYDVIHPVTNKPCEVPERGWVYGTSEKMQQMISLGVVEFRADHTEPPIRKAHIRPLDYELDFGDENETDADESESADEELASQVRGSYFYKQSQVAVRYLRNLMGGKFFDNPKDHVELRRLVQYVAGSENAIVLDFFAGSGVTADAVLEANSLDGQKRRFLLVQLPEPLSDKDKTGSNALKAGFQTVVDITKKRVRRVIKKLNDEDDGKLPLERAGGKEDRGFRVYKLDESNFKTWEAEKPKTAGELLDQMQNHVNHIRKGRSDDDILYELLLKSGFPLTTAVEKLRIAGKTIYSVANGALLVCLERKLTLALIRAIAEKKPERVVCLDEGFAGNDQLKANAVQIFKQKGVTKFQTV